MRSVTRRTGSCHKTSLGSGSSSRGSSISSRSRLMSVYFGFIYFLKQILFQASAMTPASDRYDKSRVDSKLMEIRNELKVKICFDENTSQPLQSCCTGILINDINNQESENLFQMNIISLCSCCMSIYPMIFHWKIGMEIEMHFQL